MAYDERLAERIRKVLAAHPGVTERKMFGGIAFMVDGKMCVGVINNDLMVRSGPDRYAEALSQKHTRPMDFTGRPMTGMLYVSSAGVTRGAALERWINVGLAGARESQSRTAKKRSKERA